MTSTSEIPSQECLLALKKVLHLFDRHNTTTRGNLVSQDQLNPSVRDDFRSRESSSRPEKMEATQVDEDPRKRVIKAERPADPGRHLRPLGTGSGGTDGGEVMLEAEAPQKRTKTKAQREQMEKNYGSETRGR